LVELLLHDAARLTASPTTIRDSNLWIMSTRTFASTKGICEPSSTADGRDTSHCGRAGRGIGSETVGGREGHRSPAEASGLGEQSCACRRAEQTAAVVARGASMIGGVPGPGCPSATPGAPGCGPSQALPSADARACTTFRLNNIADPTQWTADGRLATQTAPVRGWRRNRDRRALAGEQILLRGAT
jgi:hypothetical protein